MRADERAALLSAWQTLCELVESLGRRPDAELLPEYWFCTHHRCVLSRDEACTGDGWHQPAQVFAAVNGWHQPTALITTNGWHQ